MDTELLGRLIEMVQSASPVIWESALRRVYVVIITDFVWASLLFGAAYASYRYARSMWDEWYDEAMQPASVIVISVLVLLGALVLTSGLMWLGSPEYAAINFLADLVK